MTSSMRICPYCGENILEAARKCKHCGEFLDQALERKEITKQGGLRGATICFVVGFGIMFFIPILFFIYGPLFVVSFILSIVAIAQKRVLGGIILILLNLIVPTVYLILAGLFGLAMLL